MITPIAMGLGAAAGAGASAGILGISDVVSGRRAMRKRYEGMVMDDYHRSKTGGGLGLSHAQKSKAMSDARAAIRGDQRELQAEVARSGGVQKVENLGALANARATAIAQARSNIQAQSDALDLQRRAQLRQEMANMGNKGPGIAVKALAEGVGAGFQAGITQYTDSPESSRLHDAEHDAYSMTQENAAARRAERTANQQHRRAAQMSVDRAMGLATGEPTDE